MSAFDLIRQAYEAGLLQFGAFALQDGAHRPYVLNLDLLPSYPAVLRHAAEAVAMLIERSMANRLVCTQDSVALATLVSQQLDIPLIVHRGLPGSPAQNLLGAYDIGHPASLVSLTTSLQNTSLRVLRHDASSVGVILNEWVTLVSTRPVTSLHHRSVFTVQDAAEYLAAQGDLTTEMAAMVAKVPGD